MPDRVPNVAVVLRRFSLTGMERRDVASWLQGPRQALEDQGYDFGYRGERLGLPPTGPGAVAPMGRRVLALLIDWLASMLIARLLFGRYGEDISFATLGIFALMTIVLVTFSGASFGQRLLGLAVTDLHGNRVPILRVVIRTLLLCLVIPAVIWDRDYRGLQDKAAGSVVVRTR